MAKNKVKLKNNMPADTKSAKITAQDTIPFAEIYDNGLILNQRIKGKETYSLTFALSNANYLLLSDEHKLRKQEAYISPLNALPPDISYQELYINIPIETDALEQTMTAKNKTSDEYGKAYEENQRHFIKEIKQIGTENKMYITLSYETKSKADNPYNLLMSAANKFQNAYGELGAGIRLLNPEERLSLFHTIYHPYEYGEFLLPPDMYKKGNNVADYIAPSVFDFKSPDHIVMGAAFSRVFYVKGYGEEVDDEFINELRDNEFMIAVSKQIKLLDKQIAFDIIEKQLKKFEEERQTRNQRNAERGTNYIPYHLKKSIAACEEMLANLESNNELFDVGIYIAVSAKSKNELDSVTKSIKGICQRHHITVASAVMRQEDALNSILPLAQDYLRITDYLLSSVTANLLPFTYDRLFSPDGYFYGEDTMSKTPIIIDRKSDKNGNGFYLGKPGSGKSMFAKLEIEDTLYQTSTDRIIVIDAESEFVSQCRAHNGTVIKISSDSRNYINIFELADNQSGSEDVIKNKADLMLSVMGVFKNAPLTAQEKTIISRCTMLAYKRYIASGFDRSYLPTLLDFDRELLCQPEKDVCGDLHLYLEMYVTGANDIFSHQTNVDLANRYIDFDLRDLGANLKKAGMLILLDFVQQQVFRNFENGIWSWLYVDEFQTFYTENDDENSPGIFFEKMFARFRKYGGLATGLTQNISRVLEFSTAQSMLQNSQFIVLLEQAPENLKRITDMYGLSERQSGKLISPDVGEGVLVYKNVPYPFRKKYPENNIIYRTVTTKFQDHINAVKSK